MNSDERYELITRGLQEVIGGHNLRALLDVRDPEIYWRTAPTGKIHIGYLIPMLKIRDCVNAGCNVTILFADLHAYLDNMKSTLEQVNYRTEYYKRMISSMLTRLGVNMSRIKFVKGTDYQLEKDIMIEMFKLMNVTHVKQAQKAGSEVVKQSDDPLVSSLIYPMLQALDEKYLNADAELGGIDQRKIFGYARDYLPKIGIERKFTHLMNPIVSISRKKKVKTDELDKMSSSDSSGKIEILDSPEKIMDSANKIFCSDGVIADNSALYLIKIFIFPINGFFELIRNEKDGGNQIFYNYLDLEHMVSLGSKNNGIHPSDLKISIAHFFSDFLEPIRNEFSSEENLNLISLSYISSILTASGLPTEASTNAV